MIALVFPGQGSQKPGMGEEFLTRPEGRHVAEQVAHATGVDVDKLLLDTDEETLRQTQNAQMALFTCGLMAATCLQEMIGKPFVGCAAGHSIGEYAALVASGALSVKDGARMVKVRGDLMSKAGSLRPGTMAAVLGLERAALEEVCAEASTADEIVVVANDNCPGQLVISGDVAAVKRAGEMASAKGAKRVLPLNVSGAFHSPLMEESAHRLGEALKDVQFKAGHYPVVSNVLATPVVDAETWPTLLERQLSHPVRWTESVELMVTAMGVTQFVECGVGEVLGGLIRRTVKDVATSRVSDCTSLEATAEALGAVI